jgi:hypothetical protein
MLYYAYTTKDIAMKTYRLDIRTRQHEFNEDEVREYDDFCDPEREEILALAVDQATTLSDNCTVTRLT